MPAMSRLAAAGSWSGWNEDNRRRHVSRGHRGPRSSLSSGPSRGSAVMLRAPFLPVWAWLSVPVATESEVGTCHVVTVGPRQRHAGKRGCRRKEAQGTMVGRPGAVDVLQNLHGQSSALSPDSVQVKDQHNRDLGVIMRQVLPARVSPLLA